MTNVNDFKNEVVSVSANFRSSIPGNSSSVGFEKVRDLRMTGGINQLQLRDLAERIISDLDRKSREFGSSVEWTEGNWCRWSGVSAHAIRGHDDYRGSAQATAPRIALWVGESANEDGTVTLLLLHGTADGNMQGMDVDGLPADRAGSGTEMFFEYLWSHGRGIELADCPVRTYSPTRVAELCVWMIGSEQEWRRTRVEALFQVHYDERIPREGRQVSPLVTESDGRLRVVSRVVIGSPIVVQTPECDPLRAPGRMKRFWQRLIHPIATRLAR